MEIVPKSPPSPLHALSHGRSAGAAGVISIALRGLVAIVLAAAALPSTGLACTDQAGSATPRAGQNAAARIVIAGPEEAGPPLVVSGQVFRPDGTTPAPGVVLYVYHTDRTGHYTRGLGRLGTRPRFRGWMKTDAQGRYEYRTIRPAPYPDRRTEAHIHTQLWGADCPTQWNTDLLFADDPLLPERVRKASAEAGRFGWVCAPRMERGVAHCTHDIKLKAAADRFESDIRHGFDPAPR